VTFLKEQNKSLCSEVKQIIGISGCLFEIVFSSSNLVSLKRLKLKTTASGRLS